MRRVIGIDPSYTPGQTGFAVVEDGQRPLLIASGVLRQRGETDSEKFASLQCEVEAVCRKFEVEKGAVEKPPPFAYSRSTDNDGKALNISAVMKNSNAAAVILAALGRLGIKAVAVDAHQWKKCRGGENLNKDRMKEIAEMQFPQLKGRRISSHEAEAICLAALNL